ncbi:MAG: AraC family transcriptional regulator, partial [Bacteroidota bacterium]
MHYEYYDAKIESIFALSDHLQDDEPRFAQQQRLVKILWNRNDRPVNLEVDGVRITLRPNQLTTLTFLQEPRYEPHSPPLTAYVFNRAFYCLFDHDHEVSCNGVIFFGTQDMPIITLPEAEQAKFELLHQVFLDEVQTRDNIQGEMLRMLLKRLIIKCTRLAKAQLE